MLEHALTISKNNLGNVTDPKNGVRYVRYLKTEKTRKKTVKSYQMGIKQKTGFIQAK